MVVGALITLLASSNNMPYVSKRLLSDFLRDISIKINWLRKTTNKLYEEAIPYDEHLWDIIILTKFLCQELISEDEYIRFNTFYTINILKIVQIGENQYSIHMNLSEIIGTMVKYIESNYNYASLWFNKYEYDNTFILLFSHLIRECEEINLSTVEILPLYKILNEEIVNVSESTLKDIEYCLFPQKVDETPLSLSVKDNGCDEEIYNFPNDICTSNIATNTLCTKRFVESSEDNDDPPAKRLKLVGNENKYRWEICSYWYNLRLNVRQYISYHTGSLIFPGYSN